MDRGQKKPRRKNKRMNNKTFRHGNLILGLTLACAAGLFLAGDAAVGQ